MNFFWLRLIVLNIFLFLLNIPLDGDSLSPIGLLLFLSGLGSIFVLISFIVLLLSIFSKNRNFVLIFANFVSLVFFFIAYYWMNLAFDAVDFSSFKNVSIWYRIGPSLSFTFGILISLNAYFILKKFKKQQLPTIKIW
jgi:hypothetical protein